ncbi:enoyl-CoA hydratase-related protein [Tistrella sp. BH-R2-4]|uniref:Enoyl-CoA hydratase-related protein n=1 Tax=Tistrella arctica TaxID=3133430 RepID=A0ABU9YRH9_9PROT
MQSTPHVSTPVLVTCDGAVATVTLAMPPVNALDSAALERLIGLVAEIDADPAIRAVVLTGQGRCFSAGLDLAEELDAIEAGRPGPSMHGVALYEALTHRQTPWIAAINGAALGAGLGIAVCCDVILAADNAMVGLPEINVGMLGGARHAMRLLGHSTVSRLLLTGRPLPAAELARRGAIEPVTTPEALLPEALALAREIAGKDPVAIRHALACLREVEDMPLVAGYAAEMAHVAELARTETAQAAMRRFLKRD